MTSDEPSASSGGAVMCGCCVRCSGWMAESETYVSGGAYRGLVTGLRRYASDARQPGRQAGSQ